MGNLMGSEYYKTKGIEFKQNGRMEFITGKFLEKIRVIGFNIYNTKMERHTENN